MIAENLEKNREDPKLKEQINAIIPSTSQFIKDQYNEFILLSVPKLICGLVKKKCNVKIINRAKYRRQSRESYYMSKFVIRFDKNKTGSNYIDCVSDIFRLNNIQSISLSDNKRSIQKSYDLLFAQ